MSGPRPSAPPRTGSTRPAARPTPGRRGEPTPAVSIIVPTYNEAGNIERLLDGIATAMAGPGDAYEVVVVDDDSADGTWRRVDARSRSDPRIRLLRRVGQRGLSSAVLAGMAISRGEILVVIDGDLQHDERRIPDLVAAVRDGADVALGSRVADGGGYGPMTRYRRLTSRIGADLARLAIGVDVSDPMSGFFAVSRSRYRELSDRLNPRGFKILLEFLARGGRPLVREVPFVFRTRGDGRTKFSPTVVAGFLLSLLDLALSERLGHHRRPQRDLPDDPPADLS